MNTSCLSKLHWMDIEVWKMILQVGPHYKWIESVVMIPSKELSIKCKL